MDTVSKGNVLRKRLASGLSAVLVGMSPSAIAEPDRTADQPPPAVLIGATTREPIANPRTPSRPGAPSSTYVVTNCDDSGVGSLRDAAAHAISAGDVIDVAHLSCSRITLTTGAVFVGDVALVGPGPSVLTIDGGGTFGYHNHVFFHTGVGLFAIWGVTVTGGKYYGRDGGCVRSYASVAVYDSVVVGCSATITDSDVVIATGGAISAQGTVYI
ncbi:MAG: hypothetical protein ACREPX_10570, partial [Rhodanobacteraceae bacterium]